MIVDGVLILYTGSPKPATMLVLSQLLGREVYLKPLSQLEQKKKAGISSCVTNTLPSIQPN